MFEKFKDNLNYKIILIITLISLFFFILLTVLAGPIEETLVSMSGYGVMDFEFAWTAEKINLIFNAWGTEGKQLEAIAVTWDFAYIFAYGFFIFGAILLETKYLEGKLKDVSIYIAFTPLIAGVFDAIENINLLLMISNDSFISSGSPFIASLCATIKFSFLIVGIVFFFAVLMIILIKSIRK